MRNKLLCGLWLITATGCPGDDDPSLPDAGPAASCAPGAGPTEHASGRVAADEVWTAAASPHLVTVDTTITALVTIEPCAVVQIAPATTITVGAGGAIVAAGTAAEPITIDALDAGQPFASIRAIGGTLAFAHTTIRGGGDPLNSVPVYQAVLDVRGDQTLPPQDILRADHLTIDGSASQGVYLHEGGGFTPDSTAVTISGAAGFPIHTWSNLAGTIPDGDYTGNTTDELLLGATGGNEAITRADVTFHDRGVPYRVGYGVNGGVYVGVTTAATPAVVTLTLEASVELRFTRGSGLYIHHAVGGDLTTPARGALVAVGTEAAPIVLTSAADDPLPGDWIGVRLGAVPAAADRLDHVLVEYAGGADQSGSWSCPYTDGEPNYAAIRFIGTGAPTTELITHSTIAWSAGHGIDRGYCGGAAPSFLPTNNFEHVARCRETEPRPATPSGGCGLCSPTPACP